MGRLRPFIIYDPVEKEWVQVKVNINNHMKIEPVLDVFTDQFIRKHYHHPFGSADLVHIAPATSYLLPSTVSTSAHAWSSFGPVLVQFLLLYSKFSYEYLFLKNKGFYIEYVIDHFAFLFQFLIIPNNKICATFLSTSFSFWARYHDLFFFNLIHLSISIVLNCVLYLAGILMSLQTYRRMNFESI